MAKAMYENAAVMGETFPPMRAFRPENMRGDPGIAEPKHLRGFTDCINDDLNMPRALALAWEVVRGGLPADAKKALRQGVGGKIMASLQRALELQPAHAEAHTAMGMYHAEIIDKVGKLLGGVTYGASESQAMEHFRRALELTPRAPIAQIEYGNGLYLLFGDRRLDEVTDLYNAAAATEPLDAMEKLDVEAALAELE